MPPEHARACITHDISHPLTVIALVTVNRALDAGGLLRPEPAPGQPEPGVIQERLALGAEVRLGSPMVIQAITRYHGLEGPALTPQARALKTGCPTLTHASITTPPWHEPGAPELTPVNLRSISENEFPASSRACRSRALAYIPCVSNDSAQIQSHLAAVKDHSRLFSDFTYVYPVISRRSRGLSIGVNLNPDKVCNFNCIYCEVDRTTPGRASRVDLGQVREELVSMVRFVKAGTLARTGKFAEADTLARDIKDIAFSGDGEPTMVPLFSACVQLVADVRKAEDLRETKIVLITDAAGLDKADVKRGLEIMDANNGEIWGKLDAGTESYFRLVNRTTIRFDRILKNLHATARVRPIVIQSLFLRVHNAAMPLDELDAYCARVNAITLGGGQIKEIHAYTVARPTPEDYATRLEPEELEGIAQTVREKTGLVVQTFG